MRSLSIGATGMMAQQLNVEVISNNLANMTTTGFKRSRPEFQDLLYQNQRRTGSPSSEAGTLVPAGVQLGLGVKTAAVYRIHEQGPMVNTTNDFDLAIQGRGYFTIEMPSGDIAYTRSGNFQLSPDGLIVTADGYTVSPGITVPPNAIAVSVNPDGAVYARVPGQIEEQELGRLELATFVNEVGLQAIGNNLLTETAASGAAIPGLPGEEGLGTLLQGYLEKLERQPGRRDHQPDHGAARLRAELQGDQHDRPDDGHHDPAAVSAVTDIKASPARASAGAGRRARAVLAAAALVLVVAGLLGRAVPARAELVLAPGEPLTREGASLLVADALRAREPDATFRLELRRPVLPLANTSPVPVGVALEQLRHDPVSGEWRGLLVVRGADGRGGSLAIEGLAREQVVVPVPSVPVEAGGRLDPARLREVAVDRAALPPGAVLEPAALAGRQARRRLAAGRPVVASDLQDPASVQRGEIVTVVFERGPLRLTLLGKALEAGAIGQAVRVLNTDSGRALTAVVTGPREVQVGSASGGGS